MTRFAQSLFAVLLLGAAGCTDPVDKAAKKRIFSPEDPPKAVASASQRLPPEDVADKPEVARRVLGMGAAETTERIGPHRFTAAITFEWTGGGRTTKLTENRTLEAGPGGVAGDFHAVLDNSRDQGLEVMRVGGQVFARSRYGKFRQRLRDRGIAEREREELYGAVRDIDELFLGRMKLTPQGTVVFEGRTAWKYEVSLGPALPGAESNLPPLPAARTGPDDTTVRRQAFFDKREPKLLQGDVLVDSETSVVLKAHLDGRMAVAAKEGAANLRMTLDSSLGAIGKDPGLKAPKEFLPDQDKPLGIAAALDRFGIPHGEQKKDGGPDDEAPDEEAP
ncbi:MAG: hypothetical protein ACYC8T_30250 [Myxococcaceae bacterium]